MGAGEGDAKVMGVGGGAYTRMASSGIVNAGEVGVGTVTGE